MRLLSDNFRSVKPVKSRTSKSSAAHNSASSSRTSPPKSISNSRSWCVYLLLSTNSPIKTYVGVTTNFTRRLKQHNGELKGGARASRAGRPWVCASIIRGFIDRSQAFAFESKWKFWSRKLPRKRANNGTKEQSLKCPDLLLLHRQTALDRVKASLDCSNLEIEWKIHPS
ncbi:hypothetical protein K2173_011251 [Erythroxylum novogranatense]|uniref:GIY-YIG domain-containing protein n=1 Tax=Erythroxylum novogranatense TaxID=1862640 RepID=A0AAV8S9I0_9ROSI|nr:hypothetical protein K2173_011251 [Erythroxylum novogranatense]